MKRTHSRPTVLVALLLALLMLASAAFAGCGKNTTTTGSGSNAAPLSAGSLKLKKVNTLKEDTVSAADGGLYYRNDEGKHAVMSLDGKKDTGAIYVDVSSTDRYFEVRLKQPENEDDLEGINSTGLIDGSGKEIIPAEYAVIKALNDRYWRAIKATEKTDSDDYLVYMSTGAFVSLSAKEGDPRYKGTWVVYDVTTGKPVEGVTGTNNYSVGAYNDVVQYHTDDGETVYVNAQGARLPENSSVFSNGCYSITQGNDYTIYDSGSKELFTCTSDGFVPSTTTYDDDYFVARKTVNGESTYVLMDLTGKTVSFEFKESSCRVFGSYLFVDGGLYDFEGNKIVNDSKTYKRAYSYKARDCGILLSGENDDYTLLDTNGNILWTGKSNDSTSVNTSDLTVSKGADNVYTYFCWKDKDFTVKNAYTLFDMLLVRTTTDHKTFDLVDTVTGETLLSGYSNFEIGGNTTDGFYVYATMQDDSLEIYSIS